VRNGGDGKGDGKGDEKVKVVCCVLNAYEGMVFLRVRKLEGS